MKLTDIISRDKDIDEETRAELLAAIASKGKNKDLVRASKPKGKGSIGWTALMSVLAPQRAGFMALIMASGDEKTLFDKCDKFAEFWRGPINAIGQRPYQFNLWAHRYDPDKYMQVMVPKITRILDRGFEATTGSKR
jgi:hypothetical protein